MVGRITQWRKKLFKYILIFEMLVMCDHPYGDVHHILLQWRDVNAAFICEVFLPMRSVTELSASWPGTEQHSTARPGGKSHRRVKPTWAPYRNKPGGNPAVTDYQLGRHWFSPGAGTKRCSAAECRDGGNSTTTAFTWKQKYLSI